MDSQPEVTLLTRIGCHLCEAAQATVAEVTEELGLTYREINIDEHPDLKARHDTEVPVVLVNGEVKDFWQINGRRLRKILRAQMP